MTTRRRAREVVLQVLFEDDLNPTHNLAVADQFLVRRLRENKPLVTFARDLLAGVRKNRQMLDRILTQHAANWSVKRMAATDRNVLRLATYEMVLGGIPGRVVINEAVELSKRYGNRNSGQFVNGILDRVLREHSPGESNRPKEIPAQETESTDQADQPSAVEPVANAE